MNHWKNIEPITGTFEATSDFADWLKELKKSSIVEIDIIGLHDKTTGEKREFVAIEKVLEIIDNSIEDVEALTTGREGAVSEERKEGMLLEARLIRTCVVVLKEGGEVD